MVALKAHKLKPIPLSGQDATTQGVQNIISGWQTMTVCKDVNASSRPRPRRRRSRSPRARSRRRRASSRPRAARSEPAYLIPPQSITKANWQLLIAGAVPYLKKADVCSGEYKKYC